MIRLDTHAGESDMTGDKTHCERCRHVFGANEPSYACQYACTFCEACATTALHLRCPNCQGVLEDTRLIDKNKQTEN